MNRPRRNVPKKSYADELMGAYPDCPPSTPAEKRIHHPNMQSFPSKSFAHIDDLLFHCLCATKSKPKHYLALTPGLVGSDDINKDLAFRLTPILNQDRTVEGVGGIVKKIMQDLSSEFSTRDEKIIEHLLYRYRLLYSPESNVQIDKVSFNGVCAGIRAATPIGAGVSLLTLCVSLSSDPIPEGGPYVIQPHPSMAGTQGPRMMFGPGRLVNHDCNPNSQLRHIPKTHSYQFITICPIALGESITVQYTAQGGFGSSGTAPEGTKCLCATCNPTNPPTLKRRSPPPPLVSAKLKPTRRMKKRLKRLREAEMETEGRDEKRQCGDSEMGEVGGEVGLRGKDENVHQEEGDPSQPEIEEGEIIEEGDIIPQDGGML